METTKSSKYIYRGKILSLRTDTVSLPGGKTAAREIVEHAGASAVVPVLGDGRLLLIKQFRKPVEESLIEIPAGKLDSGESPLDCARRELEEETGFQAHSIKELFVFYPTPGYSSEKITVFKAENLRQTGKRPDDDEFIEILKLEKEKALELVRTGHIKDGKTIAGILAVLFEAESRAT